MYFVNYIQIIQCFWQVYMSSHAVDFKESFNSILLLNALFEISIPVWNTGSSGPHYSIFLLVCLFVFQKLLTESKSSSTAMAKSIP